VRNSTASFNEDELSVTVEALYACQNHTMHKSLLGDFRLPPQYTRELRSSVMLRSVRCQFIADVSGQPLRPIFMGQEIVTLVDVTYNLSLGVGKELTT